MSDDIRAACDRLRRVKVDGIRAVYHALTETAGKLVDDVTTPEDAARRALSDAILAAAAAQSPNRLCTYKPVHYALNVQQSD